MSPAKDKKMGNTSSGTAKGKKRAISEDIDPEIKAIFIEEAAEVLDTLSVAFPRWQQDTSDEDARAETRRAFHTLKGSGRMVGADEVGELGWAVENMLNRVLDGRIDASFTLLELVSASLDIIPSMVQAYDEGSTNFDQHREETLRNFMIEVANGKDVVFPEEAAPVSAPEEDHHKVAVPDNYDQELVDIFAAEAGIHLKTLAEFVSAQREKAPFYEPPSTKLQAALHTLKGSAHMAGIDAIAQQVIPLERFVKELLNFQVKVDEDSIDLLSDCCAANREAIAALGEGRIPDTADADNTLGRIAELRERMIAPILREETEVVTVDPAFLNLLMTEGMQAILDADNTLADWLNGAVVGNQQLEVMAGELRQLEQGAAKAGFPAMASFSAVIAQVYERLQLQNGIFDPEQLNSLSVAHGALLNMADAVAANQDVLPASGSLIAALEAVSLNAPVVVASIENIDDLDEEIVELFLAEAEELLESLEQGLQSWLETPANSRFSDSVKRDLHTFKGGARMAGLESLGDMSHEFEAQVMSSEATLTLGNIEPMAELLAWYDKLSAGVEGARTAFIAANEAKVSAQLEIPESVSIPEADIETPAPVDIAPTWSTADILPFTGNYKGLFPQEQAVVSDVQQTVAEQIRISAQVLDNLVNLAGESSISRSQVEQNINEFIFSLDEMEATIRRMQDQVRRLAIETDAQVMFRREQIEASDSVEGFDPLEMDRYSQLQQLSRSLLESASDLQDLRDTLLDKSRDAEALLLQQSRINTDLQESLMRTRMVPFSRIVPRLRRLVRQVSASVGKKVKLQLGNIEGELDRSVLDRVVPPLEHMIRNAIDHGIETVERRAELGKDPEGTISISFSRESGDVLIRMVDDGAGLNIEAIREKAFAQGLITEHGNYSDHEIAQNIFQPGFSTSTTVTQTSGRGVGMDVVNSEVRQLGGAVSMTTQRGAGTEFLVRLPFTVSVNRALMIQLGEDSYALALNSIAGVTRMSADQLTHYYQNPTETFEYGGEPYQVRYLGSLLSAELRPTLDTALGQLPIVLIKSEDANYAVQVDTLVGSREIVVKALGVQFSRVPGLSGATVLGDGGVVVILDLQGLLRDQKVPSTVMLEPVAVDEQPEEDMEMHVQTVMVVDDSVTVRKVTSRFLEREGFRVVTAKDGVDAMRALQDLTPDLMLLDIEMPRMDGFEVARLVRSTQRLKELPIIMITSRTGDKHRERALSMGVNRYLGKPYQEDVLIREVYGLLTSVETG